MLGNTYFFLPPGHYLFIRQILRFPLFWTFPSVIRRETPATSKPIFLQEGFPQWFPHFIPCICFSGPPTPPKCTWHKAYFTVSASASHFILLFQCFICKNGLFLWFTESLETRNLVYYKIYFSLVLKKMLMKYLWCRRKCVNYSIRADCLETSREATDILREKCLYDIFRNILKELKQNEPVVKSKFLLRKNVYFQRIGSYFFDGVI